ncbi:hypothetical protein BD779DRAFT_1477305 [Infundibulicybe gibba]|nr:hypothetical protein BD779DRAFT_1477305 [Infundibulicybe gibba]
MPTSLELPGWVDVDDTCFLRWGCANQESNHIERSLTLILPFDYFTQVAHTWTTACIGDIRTRRRETMAAPRQMVGMAIETIPVVVQVVEPAPPISNLGADSKSNTRGRHSSLRNRRTRCVLTHTFSTLNIPHTLNRPTRARIPHNTRHAAATSASSNSLEHIHAQEVMMSTLATHAALRPIEGWECKYTMDLERVFAIKGGYPVTYDPE